MSADAVIFIPGIKGTKLVNTNRASFDTIWSGLQSNFETIEDLEFTHALDARYYDEPANTIIRPGEIESLAYGEFLSDLQTDKPIYIYNYDWRFSAVDSGARLARFVEYLVEKSRASRALKSAPFKKFAFITHSLGNFVLRNYVKREGFGRVDRIVFTVPPFRGSLDIAQAAIIGEGWFPNVKAKVRKLLRTFPGAVELLPTYDLAGRFASGGGTPDFFNPDNWQANIIHPTKPAARELAKKFAEVLAASRNTVDHELQDLATLTEAQRKKILIITRTGYDTWQSMRIFRHKPGEPDNFFDFGDACKTGNGDARVPDVSSCCYHDQVLTLTVQDHENIFYPDYSHGFVLKDERVQKIVNRFLNSTPAKFDWRIPGGTVRQVKGLQQKVDKDKDLPYWQTITTT